MSERQSEIKWIVAASLILVFITSIPYLLGFGIAKSAGVTFGGFIFGVEDGNSYIAKMLLGQSGDWLFRTPYTAYAQTGLIAFLPYLLIGKLASGVEPHLQLVALFQIFRWAGIFYLTYESYYFIKLFLDQSRWIKTAVIFASIGGGLGWLAVQLLDGLPLEFYSPETFGFLSLLGLPHLCFSRGLMFRSFRMMIEPGTDIFRLNRKLTAGIYLFLSGFFQPISIPIGWLIVGVWKLYGWLREKRSSFSQILNETWLFFLIPMPFFLYNAVKFLFDPYLRAWETQNVIKSPPIGDYIWAYGIGYLCLILVNFVIKKRPRHNTFLVLWSILLPLLVYLPVNLQRRLADGFWVVLCIYLAIGIGSIKRLALRWSAYGLICLSTVFLLAGSINAVLNFDQPYYQSNEMIRAFNELNKVGNKNNVVLAPYLESNLLPAYAPVRVVTGHGPESKNLKEIDAFVTGFYSGQKSETEILSFFAEFDIKYVIFESSSPGISKFEQLGHLAKVFENESYIIYECYFDGTI